jgi:hypothetical protein
MLDSLAAIMPFSMDRPDDRELSLAEGPPTCDPTIHGTRSWTTKKGELERSTRPTYF